MTTGSRTAPCPSGDVIELAVSYRDTRAGDLRLAWDLPPQDALVTRRVDIDTWTVELRILGASHQVLAYSGDLLACSETVACLPDGTGGPLPEHHLRRRPVADHSFSSCHHRLNPVAFERRVDELTADLDGDGLGLCGRFPGDVRATTGLRLHPVRAGELRWTGWHSYPRTAEVVTTSSRLVLSRADDLAGPPVGRSR